MWHAKNLENGIPGSYLDSYGLGSATLNGTYTRTITLRLQYHGCGTAITIDGVKYAVTGQ